MGKRTWTPTQDATLRSCWVAEVSLDEIARRAGHSVAGVKRRRRYLGLLKRHGRLAPRSYSLRLDAPLLVELRRRARDRKCSLATLMRRVLMKECGLT